MKETIPNDLPGRSEQNTFLKYDIFEAKEGVAPLSVRSAYDLSDPYVYQDNWDGGFINSISKYWDNKIFGSGYPSASGYGGNLVPYFYNKGVMSREYYESNYSKILTFDQQGYVPEFNQDTILYAAAYFIQDFGIPGGSTKIKTARSGYYEFTFKTNKQNSIIGYGNSDLFQQTSAFGVDAQLNASANVSPKEPVVITSDYAYIQEENVTNKTFSINLKNGKINVKYKDNLINHEDDFEITGNLNVADDKWHHVVVNIGRPGTLRERGLKFNKKFIEIWIDGELDFRTTDYINNKNIFFPLIDWMLMDPSLAISYDNIIENGWNTPDRDQRSSFDEFDRTIGLNEILPVTYTGNFSAAAMQNAFKGSFHTIVYGVNYCLNKFEIQQRLRLWRGYEKQMATVFNVTAEMVNPTVNANKKKALKLFWNNLINDKAKDGIELDSNFVVDSYSVTHKIKNSKTEVNNIDVANSKSIIVLEDVRAAITSNLILWGPGVDTYYNDSIVTGILNKEVNILPEIRQFNPLDLNNEPGYAEFDYMDSIYNPEYNPTGTNKFTTFAYNNLLVGGVKLESGDRILLTNQFSKRDNGIYVFNSLNKPLTRAVNASSPFQINNGVVRVTDGQFKDTSWTLESDIDSLLDDQKWIQLEYNPNSDNINTQPIFTNRWTNEKGLERLIDLQQDININSYDLIVFMNYPETSEEVKESLVGYSDFEVKIMYDNFIKSLRNVCAQGASLYVSSPKLAIDLGVVKKFTGVSQMTEDFDSQSALITPFEVNETADKYFDTHRNNKYNVATEVAGLTNKATYILTDFINYNVGNTYDYEQYHAKYAYRQLGLKEGNEFFIPGLALREVTENTNLPGFGLNRKGLKDLMVVDPIDIVVGTTVTKLANNVYQGSSLVANQYDDYATTIIVHNNQVLNGQPITGKIFINCVEDGYTFSRQDYNKAVIQVLPTPDVNETTATRAWQYSTTRLNRSPQRINIRELTEFGQTTPTNGGGGPLIQSPTNSSSGIIRSGSDKDNANYQSDLYPKQEEEIYTLQEIPVLSMTYLGLQWLAE